MRDGALAALFVLTGACWWEYQDRVTLTPIFTSEVPTDCEKACADPEIHSVNFCTVATSEIRPFYLACEARIDFGNGPDDYEAALELPSGFDPTLRGAVDLKFCYACAAAVKERMHDSIMTANTTACTVAERPKVYRDTKYLVCSVRTKTTASFANP